jgi:hypothetical protein
MMLQRRIETSIKALLPCEKLTSEYLCNVVWALNRQVLVLVDKSSHDTRKLQTPKLLDFRVYVPPIPEQKGIVAYCDKLRAKVNSLQRMQADTAAELDALLPSILDNAFKGEL